MFYRVTTQHLESSSEQSVLITTSEENAKKVYVESSESDYFSLLERKVNNEWERVIFQIEHGNIEKEINYVLNH